MDAADSPGTCGVPMTPGICSQGAAVLGLSIKQWDRWHDMRCNFRMAQSAIDGLRSGSAVMLQSHTSAAFDLTTAVHKRYGCVSESEESQYQSC